jgi:ABC-type multidrug transport system fused ATPase/permease subunit
LFSPKNFGFSPAALPITFRYGKEDATEEEVLEALEIAQAAKFVQAMPDGIHSNVSQGGHQLSAVKNNASP